MKYKTERQWYASPEHFRSEKSWEEYRNRARKRKPTKRRISNPFRINIPRFRF